MSEESNDAIDILSELEDNNNKNLKQEQNTSQSEIHVESQSYVEDISNSQINAKNNVETESKEKIRNIVFIGNKTIMTYVNSTLTILSSSPFVTIKARGKRITQAVDVSQFIIKRMDSVGYKISDVRISSESLLSQDGKNRNVSLLAIDISNQNI
jgi:DNA-binding protein